MNNQKSVVTRPRQEWLNPSTGKISCPQCGTTWPDAAATFCQFCADHEAKLQAQRERNVAFATDFSRRLVGIRRTAKLNGFRFEGVLPDGSTILLRTTAMRPYAFAAIHSVHVVSKFWCDDPRAFVTFHKATPRPAHSGDTIIRTVQIDEGAGPKAAAREDRLEKLSGGRVSDFSERD